MLKPFVRDMLTYMPSRILPGITAFITTPILTKLLLPAEYGYWAIAVSASAFLVALSVSGFASAAIRLYPAYQAQSALDVFYATMSVCVVCILSIVAAISFLVMVLAKTTLPASFYQLLPLIVWVFVVQAIFTVFIAVVRAQGRSGAFTSFQLFTTYGGLGLGLFLIVSFGFRVEGLLWGTLLVLALSLPPLIFFSTKGVGLHVAKFRRADAVRLWHFAWPLALGNVAMWALRLSDLYIIGFFRPEREVGIYSVSYNVSAKSIELIVALFLLNVSPLLYSTWEKQGRGATEANLTMVTRLYLVLCLPAAVGVSVLAYPFVALLTSPPYHEGARIVPFVVFASFAWGLSDIALTGMLIKRNSRRLGTNQVASVGVHIGLQLLLVPLFGYVAASITTLVGYTLLLLLNALGSRPYLSWRFPFPSLRNTVVASAVMGVAASGVYMISGSMTEASPFFLLVSIAVAVPVYFISLWCLGEVKENEKQVVWRALYRVKGDEHV